MAKCDLAVISAIVLGGCSGSTVSPTPSTPSAFAATWSCTNNVTDTFTKPSILGTRTETTTSSLTLVDNANGTISASSASDASSPCALTFLTNGGTATIASGQSCVSNGISVTFTAGTYTVDGSTMTGSFSATFSGDLTDGSAAIEVSGTEVVSSSCTQS